MTSEHLTPPAQAWIDRYGDDAPKEEVPGPLTTSEVERLRELLRGSDDAEP